MSQEQVDEAVFEMLTIFRDVAEVLAKEEFHALTVVEEHNATIILDWDCNNHRCH